MSNETSDDIKLHVDHIQTPSDPIELLKQLGNKIDKSSDLTRSKSATGAVLYQAVCYSGETNEMAGDGLGLSSARFISTDPDNGDSPTQLRQIKFSISIFAEPIDWLDKFKSVFWK